MGLINPTVTAPTLATALRNTNKIQIHIQIQIKEQIQIQIQIQAQTQIQKHENESQFHKRDSFSKVEVKLGNCLWIELTYEVINQSVYVY